MKKKARISFLLAVVLTGALAGDVYAASEREAAPLVGGLVFDTDENNTTQVTGDEEMVNAALCDEENAEPLVGASLPGSYRTEKLTEVSNQGNTSLCWAFACLDSGEIGLLGDGALSVSQNSQLFSPGHLAYATYHGKGDTWKTLEGSSWWNYGGNTMMASSTLLRWYGAAFESDYPTVKDLKLTDAQLMDSRTHLVNYMRLPEVNYQTYNKSTGEYSYAYNTDSAGWKAAVNAIKQAVMDYDSLTVDLLYEGIDQATGSLYSGNLENQKNKPDHQVVIVGWDDARVTRASRPGAFLIKNTWNSSWGENGYGWLSYYDRTYVYPTVYQMEPTVSGNHLDEDIYYYDGIGYKNWMYDRKDKQKISSANVFTADKDELIDAVGVYLHANSSYTISVLTNLKDGTPNTGTVVDTVKGTRKYFGFYTIPLNKIIRVARGQRFAVTVSSKDTDGIYYCYYEGDQNEQCAITCERGQSFYSYGTAPYKDVKDYPYEPLNNACIKAYGNADKGQDIFLDVTRARYYYDAVQWAKNAGIVSGTQARTFSPNTNCSRAQIVSMLYRAKKDDGTMALNTLAVNPFADVAKNKYYYQPVLWAAGNKVTSGIGETEFAPDSSCTRAQAVAFLYRMAGSPSVGDPATDFTDVNVDAYYAAAVKWAVAEGITSGTTATTFAPNEAVTRGQMATFLYNTYGK